MALIHYENGIYHPESISERAEYSILFTQPIQFRIVHAYAVLDVVTVVKAESARDTSAFTAV